MPNIPIDNGSSTTMPQFINITMNDRHFCMSTFALIRSSIHNPPLLCNSYDDSKFAHPYTILRIYGQSNSHCHVDVNAFFF